MQRNWAKHQSFNVQPENNWSLDETAFTYAAAPLCIFVPKAQDRAEGKLGDTKVRITAVVNVNQKGDLAPLLMIKRSKGSDEKPDQTGMAVLDRLHGSRSFAFHEEDDWKLGVWSCDLQKIENGERTSGQTVEHRVKFLYNERAGHAVTSQKKAWNDTVRMRMCVNLIVRGRADPRSGIAIKSILNRDETSMLSMDMSFKPQAPKAHEAMQELFKRFETDVTTEKMRSSVIKSLLDTGAGPDENGVYRRCHSNKRAAVKLEVKSPEPSLINFRTFQHIASMAMEGEFADDMIDDDDDDSDEGVEEDEDDEEAPYEEDE